MKKTYCDRCGALVEHFDVHRYTVYEVSQPKDLCEQCHSELAKWMFANPSRENLKSVFVNQALALQIDMSLKNAPWDELDCIDRYIHKLQGSSMDNTTKILEIVKEFKPTFVTYSRKYGSNPNEE